MRFLQTIFLTSLTLVLATKAFSADSVVLNGVKMQCAKTPIYIDNRLPTEGAFESDGYRSRIVLNMRLLNKQPGLVRLFVFAHECAHGIVGGSELKADCYAVKQGVKEGWIDEKGTKQICDSFEGAPE